ncbi:MAG TPA: amino acid permease [Kofleriaceae bacterium]|nr:amino acid permease [Kofleriaceae bacterium]
MTAPKRQLGLGITAAIVVANMIGTGVFTSTGFQAKGLGDPKTILIAWVVGGIVALCGAACYAELGTLYPKAGGEYVYLREAYHPVLGFLSGWVSMTAGFSAAIATSALLFSDYLTALFDQLAHRTPDQPHVLGVAPKFIAAALIVGVTCMHAFDTKIGGRVQQVFTIMKVLLIIGFVAAGLGSGNGDWNHFATQHGGYSNIATTSFAMTLMYVSFAYSGWNAAAYIAGEVDKPEKTIPRALLVGTGAVMVLYVLLNVVYFYAVPSDVLAGPPNKFAPIKEVGNAAAIVLFGTTGGNLITSLIAIALVSAVSAMVMAGPRVYAAMAEDHALPKQLAWYSKRGVPTVAVVVQGVLGIAFVMLGDLGSLIRFAAFTLAIFAALTVAALFIVRMDKKLKGPYKTFGYPVTPVLFIATSIWIAYAQIKEHPKESLVVLGVLVFGAVVYVLAVKPPPKPNAPANLPEARVVDE